MNNRIEKLLKVLEEQQLDSVFITSKENVFYFTGLYANAHERLIACYFDRFGRQILIVPALELEDAKSTNFQGNIISYFDHENPWEKIKDDLNDRQIQSLAIEKDDLNVTRYETIQSYFKNVEIVNGQALLNQIRLIKDEHEYQLLLEAAQYADFAIETALKHITVGKSELGIIAEIEYALKKEGIQSMSFPTTVLTGVKSALPHGTPDETTIKDGDFVLMDLGVIHNGYCSDITRTVVVGKASDKQKEIYNIVLQAELAALDGSQTGTPLGDIDQAARKVIENAGYGEYFPHRVGHGLGINVHEFPSLASNNDAPLQEGMCYTIEPGIYLPNVGGVRIEDDVFITKEGPVTLTKFTKDLIEL
ncbi:M24 family metallopeptidase [Bacillaceae bacterium W0354]